jgi:hypothetical protein
MFVQYSPRWPVNLGRHTNFVKLNETLQYLQFLISESLPDRLLIDIRLYHKVVNIFNLLILHDKVHER